MTVNILEEKIFSDLNIDIISFRIITIIKAVPVTSH